METISRTDWEWLEKDNADQSYWAFCYLVKKGLISSTCNNSYYETVIDLVSKWPNDAKHREMLTVFHTAWNAKLKRLLRVDRASFNCTISNSAKEQLNAIAKQRKLTINKTIEFLIEEAFAIASVTTDVHIGNTTTSELDWFLTKKDLSIIFGVSISAVERSIANKLLPEPNLFIGVRPRWKLSLFNKFISTNHSFKSSKIINVPIYVNGKRKRGTFKLVPLNYEG